MPRIDNDFEYEKIQYPRKCLPHDSLARMFCNIFQLMKALQGRVYSRFCTRFGDLMSTTVSEGERHR